MVGALYDSYGADLGYKYAFMILGATWVIARRV